MSGRIFPCVLVVSTCREKSLYSSSGHSTSGEISPCVPYIRVLCIQFYNKISLTGKRIIT